MSATYQGGYRWCCERCGSRMWVKRGREWYCADCGWRWEPGREPAKEVEQRRLDDD
jgi:hypothetical protein